MSGISLNVDVRDGATPLVRDFISRLGNLSELHEFIGHRMQAVTRDHLLALDSHATANRLGAQPSGHWAQAAEKTSYTSDATSATLLRFIAA